MRALAVCLAGGAAALLTITYGAAGTGIARLGAALENTAADAVVVERARKGDRLPGARTAQAGTHAISTVEVVGLDRPAIIYRDRAGRMLFHTDPVENATLVVRGVKVPEVTVRETSRSTVQPVVVEQPQPAATRPAAVDRPAPPASKPKLPDGCEPMVSPLTGSHITGIPGRCVATAESPIRLAAAR